MFFLFVIYIYRSVCVNLFFENDKVRLFTSNNH